MPEGPDGSVDPAKAISINEQFQLSRQFWACNAQGHPQVRIGVAVYRQDREATPGEQARQGSCKRCLARTAFAYNRNFHAYKSFPTDITTEVIRPHPWTDYSIGQKTAWHKLFLNKEL